MTNTDCSIEILTHFAKSLLPLLNNNYYYYKRWMLKCNCHCHRLTQYAHTKRISLLLYYSNHRIILYLGHEVL